MALQSAMPARAFGANDRITLGVIGIRGRGRSLARSFIRIPGVQIKTLCDVDENLFAERVTEFEEVQKKAPKTETMRETPR